MNLNILVAGGVVGTMAFGALGDQLLQFDVNSLRAVATGPLFSTGFTGTLLITDVGDFDANAEITDLLVDGNPQGVTAAFGDFFFEMNIEFDSGKIVTGDIKITADADGIAGGATQTYDATIAPSAGVAILDIGGTFQIGGITLDGTWTTPTGPFALFLGVDISPWGDVEPDVGSFADVFFDPGADNISDNSQADVWVMIPLPGPAAMAGLGLTGLLVRRRR